jgi:hypothetical protein
VGGAAIPPAGVATGAGDPQVPGLACLDMDGVLAEAGGPIEMLHMDAQGAELAFIGSMRRAVEANAVRFAVVSTHHESVFSSYQNSTSGAPTNHEECVAALESLGATVLMEHGVFESFSGDGLIVASFAAADRSIVLPRISRNVREKSLFPDVDSPPPIAVVPPPPAVAEAPRGWLQRQVTKLGRSCRKRLPGRAHRRVA